MSKEGFLPDEVILEEVLAVARMILQEFLSLLSIHCSIARVKRQVALSINP